MTSHQSGCSSGGPSYRSEGPSEGRLRGRGHKNQNKLKILRWRDRYLLWLKVWMLTR